MAEPASFRQVQIEWGQPAPVPRGVSPAMATPRSPGPAEPGSEVVEQLRSMGHIVSVGAASPRDELLALLTVAAEVEHALVIQYLYAAASVRSGPVQRIIRDIAVQEMAHFITVENLLLALGGPTAFHIGRDLARTSSAFNPLPFDLEPVSRLSLAEFVLAERPLVVPQEQKDRVLELEKLVVCKTGHRPVRVGALYARIYWLLQPTDEPFGPLALTPAREVGFDPGWHVQPSDFTSVAVIAAHQADPDEWFRSSGPDMRIHLVQNADAAVNAVFSIMAQGEGPAHTAGSHFDQFLIALSQFEAGTVTVLPLPKNPYVGHLPLGGSEGTPLQHDYVKLWANLSNVRYTALLLHLGQALLTPRDSNDRNVLIGFLFGVLMGSNLGGLIGHMTSPFLTALDGNSAPTFELLREDMPQSLAECWQRQSQLLDIEQAIRDALRQRPELTTDVDGIVLLNDLEASWQELRAFVDAH